MTTDASVSEVKAAYLLPYTGLTLNLYTFQLKRWLSWCEEQHVNPLEVTRSDVERYIHHLHLEVGQKPSSVHTALTPVRGFYRFAYDEEVIPHDPAARARRPHFVNEPRDTLGLDRDQMRAFLAAGRSLGGRYQAAAYLLACMALRAAETCSIRVEDYSRTVRGHRVLEFEGKGGAFARMPLPVPVVRALDEAADGRTSGQLILRRDGGPLTRQGLGTITRTIGKRAGLESPIRPHLLRHSCITNALEAGAPLHKVQDLARHREPRTTMQYAHNRSNLDDHAVHSLVAFLGAGSDEPRR